MKKLPIGIADFKKLRKGNFIYIDKTPFIEKLLSEGSVYFLSRPRRFGKSLFLSTLYYYFKNQRQLFKGLYIDQHWEVEKEYAVIRLTMTSFPHSNIKYMKMGLNDILREHFVRYETEDYYKSEDSPTNNLRRLISVLIERHREVVILIDEYDAPLTNNLFREDLFEEVKVFLREFYRVLKDYEGALRFVFVTGVTKFAHVTLFSGFNNLNDISLLREYSTICGYTQKELEEYFREYFPEREGEREELLRWIREWYNGYDFYGYDEGEGLSYEEHKERYFVYNPYDVLLFFRDRTFGNYWFATATPHFLIEFAQKRGIPIKVAETENKTITKEDMEVIEVNQMNTKALMYQTGYLTIERRYASPESGLVYTLRIPNKEVRYSLGKYLLEVYFRAAERWDLETAAKMLQYLKQGDVEGFLTQVQKLYEWLPYPAPKNVMSYEDFHRDVFITILWTLNIRPTIEDVSLRGRVDMVFEKENNLYIVEFKVNDGKNEVKEALKQIKKKGYHKKYENSHKRVFLIGIEYDRKARTLRWLWETCKSE